MSMYLGEVEVWEFEYELMNRTSIPHMSMTNKTLSPNMSQLPSVAGIGESLATLFADEKLRSRQISVSEAMGETGGLSRATRGSKYVLRGLKRAS